MHNIYYILATIIYLTPMIHAMEEASPSIKGNSESSSSSHTESPSTSSPSTPTKKSILKKAPRQGDKKALQFNSAIEERTYEKEQVTESLPSTSDSQQQSVITREQALQELISFAETTRPEVEQIIDSCVKDILEIWNFYSIEPTDAAKAQENFAKLDLALKDYEINVLNITNRITGKQSDSIITAYQKTLNDLKRDSQYEANSNRTVEQLNNLLHNCILLITRKAVSLYVASKKPALEALFSRISPDLPAEKQYHEALSCGYTFLDNTTDTETAVDAAMTKYHIRGYSRNTYHFHLRSKAQADKRMVIEGVFPYAEKIGKTKDYITYLF